jgi:hypothetical protein
LNLATFTNTGTLFDFLRKKSLKGFEKDFLTMNEQRKRMDFVTFFEGKMAEKVEDEFAYWISCL